MAFSKRAQVGKIVNRQQGGGPSKAGIPSSIGRNSQLIFRLKARSYASPAKKALLYGALIDGPITNSTITLKSLDGTILGITTSTSTGEFSFSSNLLQPNTYYIIETSSGTDTVTNLQIIVGLTLLLKTDSTGNGNIVVSPVSTILQEMIASDVNSLSTLTTEQIDTLVLQNKTLLSNYLSTNSTDIANIETTNFLKTNDVDLYKENAALYSYLMSTSEVAENTLDERQPIVELVNILKGSTSTEPTIRGVLSSELTSYTDSLTVNNNGDTINNLINGINSESSITNINNSLTTSYTNVSYPKQYDWVLTKNIVVDNSAYGVGIDPSGRYLAHTRDQRIPNNGKIVGIIYDLSNNSEVAIPNVTNDTSGELFDLTMNDKYVVVGTNATKTSQTSFAQGKGYVRVYKRTGETWASMIDISGTISGDSFGYGLGLNGDNLIVSAYRSSLYNDASGVTRIYELNSSTNTATQVVADIVGEPGSFLGANDGTAISSKYAVIGSSRSKKVESNTNYSSGKALVYKKGNNGSWTLMQTIYPETKYLNGEKGHFNTDGSVKDPSSAHLTFGFSTSITDEYLAIGAYFYSDVSGSLIKSKTGYVSLYKINAAETNWDYITTFVGEHANGNYGYDIKLTKDFLFVSALNYKNATNVYGMVYVYEKGPYNAWGFKNKLINPLTTSTLTSSFGYKMDMNGEYLAVADGLKNFYLYKKTEL